MVMDLMAICITAVVVTYLLAHADISIKIDSTAHASEHSTHLPKDDVGITQEALDEQYDRQNVNNFDDVIKAINTEFGGVDNADDSTT